MSKLLLPTCVALSLSLSLSLANAGDPVAGEQQFAPCSGCHTVTAHGDDGVGPNLHGLFGRKSGSKAEFNYSSAMKAAGIVWNEDTLAKFLADPSALVPDNNMSFIGLQDAQARVDIIAYLKEATK
jgi:cytochrome c